ncbi:MAG: acyltransferase family protein [Gammaproteobacteria bacterium]|nr:acyltransferase family protein [Gammaproteobacteria bacterium]
MKTYQTTAATPRTDSEVRGIAHRRYDLDWLRVIAFGLLIYFHAAIAFVPGGIPMIQNDTTSEILVAAVAFLQEFRLALLFLVSGAGVCFALRRRSDREFITERSNRLLKPLGFGIVLLVPVMVFYEKLFTGAFDGSLIEFYGQLVVDGVYPRGNLSWHHFWFLAYLYLFCLIALPVFRRLREETRIARLQALATRGYNLYLPMVPLIITEICLRWLFPGFRDLIHDWASFTVWLIVFVAGFAFACSESLLDHTQKLRRMSLVIAVGASATLFWQFWEPGRAHFTPVGADGHVCPWRYLLFSAVKAINLWAWLMAILGYAGVYLNRPGRAVTYLNDAVFALFCVHLPLIVVLGYYAVPLQLGLWAKFALITTLTMVLCLTVYQLLVRPGTWLAPWLGGRRRAMLTGR